MNVELFYIRTIEQSAVTEAVSTRLKAEARENGSQANAPLPSSYDAFLRTDLKRKLAISPPQQGWITVLEAKEVVDFELAQRLSEQMQTDVAVVQLSDGVGARGVATLRSGSLASASYSEDDEDPEGTVSDFMAQHGIPKPIPMFREAVALRGQGWILVSR